MKYTFPSVFEYNDFRIFLADYQKARCERDPSFTKSEFSRLLQLPNTRSYFTDVLKGKVVTPTFLERFIGVLELSRDEAQFFRTLVRFNQAENPDERELLFEQLISLNRTPKRILTRKLFTYYRDWHNAVIRAVLNTGDFGDDYAAIAQRILPRITPKKVRESIQLMVSLGLVVKNSSGHYKPAEASIATPDSIRNELIKQFQLRTLDMARSAVTSRTNPPLTIATNTISISERGFNRLEKITQEYRSRVRSLVAKDEDPADRVCQLIVSLVPVSRTPPHNGKSGGAA